MVGGRVWEFASCTASLLLFYSTAVVHLIRNPARIESNEADRQGSCSLGSD